MIGEHPQRAFLQRSIDLLGHVHILLDSNRSGIKPVTVQMPLLFEDWCSTRTETPPHFSG